MSKVWKLLVVGIITALTGIILFSCSASAAEFVQVRVSSNPSGTLLDVDLSKKDVKTGLTGFELIRNSMYEDISYAMDLWISSLEKNTAVYNASKGSSVIFRAIAKDAEKTGVLPMSPSKGSSDYSSAEAKPTIGVMTEKSVTYVSTPSAWYPTLALPSVAWANYFSSSAIFRNEHYDSAYALISGTASCSTVDKDSKYLVFTSGTSVYSYPLVDAIKSSKDNANANEFVRIMQVALFDAFTPYASVVYGYDVSLNELTPVSKLSSSTSSLKPMYIIHPLVGIIPCNGYYTGTAGLDICDSRTDYFKIFYSNPDIKVSDKLGLSKILSDNTVSSSSIGLYSKTSDKSSSIAVKILAKLTKYYMSSYNTFENDWWDDHDFGDEASPMSFITMLSAGSTGETRLGILQSYVSSDLNCYMWGTAFVSQAFRDQNKDNNWSSIHAFLLSPDYISWLYKTRSSDSQDNYMTGMTELGYSKDLPTVLSANSMAKMHSSAQPLYPSYYVYTMAPIAGISEWKPTSTYGIYTNSLSPDLMGSNLSLAFSDAANGGYDAIKLEDNLPEGSYGYAYKYLRSSKNVGYTSDYSGELKLDDNKTITVEGSSLNNVYYYDTSTGTVYKTSSNALPAVLGASNYRNSSEVANSSASIQTLASQSLFTNFEVANDVKSADYYVTRTFGYALNRYYYHDMYVALSNLGMDDTSVYTARTQTLLAIPGSYAECIKDVWTSTTSSVGKVVTCNVVFYIGTGREISFDFNNAQSMDLLNTNGVIEFSNADTPAAGAYYNTSGRISTAKPGSITYDFIMLHGSEPAILLGSEYVQDSSVLNWLETSSASSYMSKYVSETGYTADLLYKRLTSKGITLNGGATADDYARYADISLELSGDMSSGIIQTVLTAISFVGLLLMVYACALVIAFYIDIFNTVTATSILSIITFGACKAVQSKQDLEEMGITDPKERKKYCTRVTILFRWAGAMLIGIIFFASSKVYTLILQLYNWLMQLF